MWSAHGTLVNRISGVSERGQIYWEQWRRLNLTAAAVDLFPRKEYVFHALLFDARADKIGISEIRSGVGDLDTAILSVMDQVRAAALRLD